MVPAAAFVARVPGDRRMLDRLRGMLVLTLEPPVLGVSASERQIVLAFFGFPGIDTLVERMDALAARARRSVLIIGVNLEGALGCTTALVTDPGLSAAPDYLPPVREFFDRQYTAHDRYWWRGASRYSTDPADHTPYHAAWLAAGLLRDLGTGPASFLAVTKPYTERRTIATARRRWPRKHVAVTSQQASLHEYLTGDIPADRVLSHLAGEALRLEAYAAIGLIDPGEPVPAGILDAARALQAAGFSSRVLS